MGIYDGELAAVTGEPTIFAWHVDHKGNLSPYTASNTDGGVGRDAGNNDWTGWYQAYVHTPAVFPGDSFTFEGSIDGTNGVSGTARCTDITWEWDLRKGDYIVSRVGFAAAGALTLGAVAVTDAAEPDPTWVGSLPFHLNGVQQGHVNFMRLMIRKNCKRYCDAEAAGHYLWTPGDKIDVTGMWRVYEDDPAAFPAVDSRHVARFYVSATTYWQITWLMIDEVDEIGVDRKQDNEPVGAVITGKFTANDGTTAGSIVNPDTTTKWP